MVGGSDSRRNRTAIISPEAKQRSRNSVAIFVWIPGLCSRMIHLKYGINEEAPRVAVVSAKSQHFADGAATRLALDMDNEIDCFSDLCLGVREGRLRMVTHHEIGKAMKGLFR